MFEAKLNKAQTLQKIVDAIKDLVQDAPFDCSEGSISLQVRAWGLESITISERVFGDK